MKTQKLIDKLRGLLSRPDEDTPRKKICKTLRELKQAQRALEAQLELTDSKHARHRLAQKIAVLRAQRLKGQQRYRELKAR
jgi:hypothetical protein